MELALDILRLALAIERMLKDKTSLVEREAAPLAFGLTSSTQMLVLAALQNASRRTWDRQVGLTPNKLSAVTGCGRSTIAMQLRVLLRGQLVELTGPEPHGYPKIDGRERRYQLTPRGVLAAGAVHERSKRLGQSMVAHLSSKEAKKCSKSLAEMIEIMSSNDSKVSLEDLARATYVARLERRRRRSP